MLCFRFDLFGCWCEPHSVRNKIIFYHVNALKILTHLPTTKSQFEKQLSHAPFSPFRLRSTLNIFKYFILNFENGFIHFNHLKTKIKKKKKTKTKKILCAHFVLFPITIIYAENRFRNCINAQPELNMPVVDWVCDVMHVDCWCGVN